MFEDSDRLCLGIQNVGEVKKGLHVVRSISFSLALISLICARGDEGLDQGGSERGDEKLSNSGYISKVQLAAFSHISNMGHERKKEQ